MRGVLVLTEGRSGSNWLGSLTRNAGMGNSGEWLARKQSGIDLSEIEFEDYVQKVLELGSSKNGCFYVKIFPKHLLATYRHFKRDFIREVCQRHDTKILILTRRDRLRQAISLSRGHQTSQWTSKEKSKRDAAYDFDQISRYYFMIGQSYEFWNSYIEVLGYPSERFVYEDLIEIRTRFLLLSPRQWRCLRLKPPRAIC